MNEDQKSILLVVVVCFVVGYWVVSALWKRKAGKDVKPDPEQPGETSAEDRSDREKHYREVLGVSYSAGEGEIRAAYRNQLAKYHPDKVTHLGEEFYDLASRKTKEIIEAYGFLKQRYGYE